MQELNIRDLDLEHNRRYHVEVKAKNGVGLWSAVGRSDGVRVDTTASSQPTMTGVLRGEFLEVTSTVFSTPIALSGYAMATAPSSFITDAGASYAMGFSSATTMSYAEESGDLPMDMEMEAGTMFIEPEGPYPNTLSARWSASSDPESGVVGYYYALGRSAESGDLVGWTFTDRREITMENLPISQGDVCYFSVRGVNGAGAWSRADTASLVIEYTDSTPPVRAPHVLASYDADTDSLRVFWYGDGGDPESGVVEYQWAIGHRATEEEAGALVQDWTSVGMHRRVERSIALVGGFTYYVKVKAINGVGLYRTGFSEAIVPPPPALKMRR
jgi:hypothetical protein